MVKSEHKQYQMRANTVSYSQPWPNVCQHCYRFSFLSSQQLHQGLGHAHGWDTQNLNLFWGTQSLSRNRSFSDTFWYSSQQSTGYLPTQSKQEAIFLVPISMAPSILLTRLFCMNSFVISWHLGVASMDRLDNKTAGTVYLDCMHFVSQKFVLQDLHCNYSAIFVLNSLFILGYFKILNFSPNRYIYTYIYECICVYAHTHTQHQGYLNTRSALLCADSPSILITVASGYLLATY